jgi:hypothetical protein
MLTQELFDKAVGGVIAQGGPSIQNTEDDRHCMYRAGNLRCAIGHLIEHYNPAMKNRVPFGNHAPHAATEIRVGQTLLDAELLKLGLTFEDSAVLNRLQKCHDNAVSFVDFIDQFKHNARRLAQQLGLAWNHG